MHSSCINGFSSVRESNPHYLRNEVSSCQQTITGFYCCTESCFVHRTHAHHYPFITVCQLTFQNLRAAGGVSKVNTVHEQTLKTDPRKLKTRLKAATALASRNKSDRCLNCDHVRSCLSTAHDRSTPDDLWSRLRLRRRPLGYYDWLSRL